MRYLAKEIDTMDIVITYVDGNDPVWKKDYEKYTQTKMFYEEIAKKILGLVHEDEIIFKEE